MQDNTERILTGPETGSGSIVSDLPTTTTITTSTHPFLSNSPKDEGKRYIMDLNVTAGVFMVLLLAIVTAILLCCCKTYAMCKKRQQRRRDWDRNFPSRRGLHQHLPRSYRYSDEPPTYADILGSGGVVSTHISGCTGTISNTISEPKSIEDTIAVHWSWNPEDSESESPPSYSHVVSQNDVISTETEVQPPGYWRTTRRPKTIFRHLYSTATSDGHLNSVSRRMRNTVYTVSSLIPWYKRDTFSTPQRDPTNEISCDGDVTRSQINRVSHSSSTYGTASDT